MCKKNNHRYSFFLKPVTRSKPPYAEISLNQVYKIINEPYYKKITKELRSISNKIENRKYKAQNFDYVTFSGTFYNRCTQDLIQHSGLMVLDFDKLDDVESTKIKLLKDPCFETQLLFISPNGNGLKWVIEVDINGKYTHGEMFDAIYNYAKSTHGIEADKSGRDVARACFLSYDPTVFIHPKYLVNEEL